MPIVYTIALDKYMLPCLNKQILGVECPGCGLQRSVSLLLEGDFGGAFMMYPAIYPLLLLLSFLLADTFFSFKYGNKITISLLILTVLFILTNFILKFV
ncbi:DUF2752 domain-containing protein [Arenibacter sp. GZD96]|uniref:DUF2752 domain-containing protein n=1 Tax=Aurantibrevibacter litoralis TaxID=3106030 RepID=UPI002AFF36FA|nr:DUF2752 domain-containing protein [Arenibacter sp. GZD-96]MEA1785948.1 DUF2752 domain-containing protein [Arenibacter sp. GZD-96]